MIPTLWRPFIIAYDKDAAYGISHWGPQLQLFYRAMINQKSKHDVFSTMRILSVVSVKVKKKYGYGYLEEIIIRRVDQKLYKFKQGDFSDLHLNDIEHMLLLIAQNKFFNLDSDVIMDFVTALKNFTREIIVKNRVEDVQLGVESYQRKLNLTKPQRTCQQILVKEPYIPNFDPLGVIYEDKSKKKRLMCVDEIHKFCDETLQSVCNILREGLLNFKFSYNKGMPLREWTTKDKRHKRIMENKIDDLLFKRRVLRSLEVLVLASPLYVHKAFDNRCTYAEGAFPKDKNIKSYKVVKIRRSGKENMQVRSVLTESEVYPTKLRKMIKPYSSTSFIANCFITGKKAAVTPKKKSSISANDNITRKPDVALELGKSISLTKAEEEEATRRVHATHECLVTVSDESDPEPTRRPTGRRRPSGIAFRDTSYVSKKNSLDQPQKLKGIQTLTAEEQLAADTMQALKDIRKIIRSRSHIGGSSEGAGVSPKVTDEVKGSFEAKVDYAIDWGLENKSNYSKEDKGDEEIEWLTTDEEEEEQDDDNDDRSIGLEETDDDEKIDDENVHGDEYVHDDVDKEMKDVEDDETGKDNKEIIDAKK
ncbi:hypothetical protein Tco_0154904 [Tanacetum coccineum]